MILLWWVAAWRVVKSKLGGMMVWIGIAFAVVAGYLFQLRSAERRGKNRGAVIERERINTETARETKAIREKADEIREDSADRSDDELRKRLRQQARRHGNR